MTEFNPELHHALRIAGLVLDEPLRDPDSDIVVLARQLMRTAEALELTRTTNDEGTDAGGSTVVRGSSASELSLGCGEGRRSQTQHGEGSSGHDSSCAIPARARGESLASTQPTSHAASPSTDVVEIATQAVMRSQTHLGPTESEGAAKAALEAVHHAELVEALRKARTALAREYGTDRGPTIQAVDAVLAKIGGAA
jgi:hypothetical protein